MLWVVLATVASALPQPAKVASTYDEAACTEAEKAQAALLPMRDADPEINCSEPPPPVPAVLDCNDARVSLWLGDMIGSCDMPKSQLPGAVAAVRAGSGSEQRLCRDGHCGVDSVPIRAAGRSLDELPLAVNTSSTPLVLVSTSFELQLMLPSSQEDGRRLERPPRTT
jgi:hypothetical protein